MDDPNELAKDIITGTISDTAGKVLDSKVSLNLLGPVTTEVGELMGQIASVARFYATDNMARIFKRWAENREGNPIQEGDFKRVLPLLPTASLVSDEELQERWARLLDATATGTGGVTLPSFGQTLAQVTPEEARYLDRLWRGPRLSVEKASLLHVYRMTLHPHRKPFTDLDWRARAEEEEHFLVILSDLIRLGLLELETANENDLQRLASGNVEHLLTDMWKTLTMNTYTFSGYGEKFMMAISNKESDLTALVGCPDPDTDTEGMATRYRMADS